MTKVPEALASTIKQVHGEAGERWLAGFGELIAYCEERWGLKLLPSDYPLSFNYVAPAELPGGQGAVLKLRVPEDPELPLETEALRLFSGRGGARLLDAVPERGILVLARLAPGLTLKTVKDDLAAVRIAAGLLRSLRIPAPQGGPFPSTEQWAKGLGRLRSRHDGGTGPIPEELVRRAEEGFEQLHRTMDKPLLLHGDLHHDNILSDGTGWSAIDPKGVVGELAYGAVPFLLNNLPDRDPEAAVRLIRTRVPLFAAELSVRSARLVAWTFCHQVLSAAWSLEDGSGDIRTQVAQAWELLSLWRNDSFSV
ncbi:aminoglycoside phosphotransferase family protein [Cohnella fermenti]|nr:aminoglycoside phosphotransferase family protein [Cohnella fermenti]